MLHSEELSFIYQCKFDSMFVIYKTLYQFYFMTRETYL